MSLLSRDAAILDVAKVLNSRCQVGGTHYERQAIQPLEYIIRNNLDFVTGSLFKYLCRWESKNGLEDIEKGEDFAEIIAALTAPLDEVQRTLSQTLVSMLATWRPWIRPMAMAQFVRENQIGPYDDHVFYALESYLKGDMNGEQLALVVQTYHKCVAAKIRTQASEQQ